MKFRAALLELSGDLLFSNTSVANVDSFLYIGNDKKIGFRKLPFLNVNTNSLQISATKGSPTISSQPTNEELINFVGDASNGVSQSYYRDGGEIYYRTQVASESAETGTLISANRSRGTLANPTAVTHGDTIFTLAAGAHDGALGSQRMALIDFKVDSNVSAGQIAPGFVPVGIYFQTGQFVRMAISPSGNVAVGINSPISSRLHIAGNAAIGYSADITVPSNSLAVAGSIYTGVGSNFFKVVGTRNTGWTKMTGSSRKALSSLSTSSITLVQLAEVVNAIYDALAAHGLIGT